VVQGRDVAACNLGAAFARHATAMSIPRRVVAGKFWMLTRRCTQQQFLLRPEAETNNAFLYCLIEAAQKFRIQLMLPQMMSNHHHVGLYDPDGFVVEFYQRFHTHLAKCINAHRGRWENMWSIEPPCLIELEDRNAILDRLVYIATNPVKDGLVEKVHHWPGPRTVNALLHGGVLAARRPTFLFRAEGLMPDVVETRLELPAVLGDHNELLAELRVRIADAEAQHASSRAASGRRVIGRRRILDQSWRACPSSREPRRNLRPRVAARSSWARVEALQRNAEFLEAYRDARARWLRDEPVKFPVGTYWLRRFAHVDVAGPEQRLTN
jgi:REP element-mobilizing transposase RayT